MEIANIEESITISFRIDQGFNSGEKISSMVRNLFELDHISFIILGVIAENGPLNASQIEKKSLRIARQMKEKDLATHQTKEKGSRKTYSLTRDKVRSRLPGTLKDYLIKKEGEIFQNTGKREKFYHLTFKGLVASLHLIPFEENYIVKKYLEFLLQWANKYYIPEISIQLIKYNLALYLVKNVIDGSKLTDSNNIDDKIFKLNSHKSLTEPNLRQKPISDKRAEINEYKIKTRLQIIQQILTQSMNNVRSEHRLHSKQDEKSQNPIDNFILNILPDYIKYWFDHIQEIQFEEIDELKPHTIVDDDFREKQIDIKNTNKEARTILNNLGIKAQFADNEVPLFFL